ncbi:Uncharacterised protein [uncultured archaeon]|nr:Uncharacterised protein [uncultured archaeon]
MTEERLSVIFDTSGIASDGYEKLILAYGFTTMVFVMLALALVLYNVVFVT